MLKIKAEKKPLTVKPSTNLSANIMIKALITKRNSPNEIMVAGKVKKINIGRTTIFNTAIVKATTKAVV